MNSPQRKRTLTFAKPGREPQCSRLCSKTNWCITVEKDGWCMSKAGKFVHISNGNSAFENCNYVKDKAIHSGIRLVLMLQKLM